MDDYEKKKFVAKSENITLSELLDDWVAEELKTSTLSNGTVATYITALNQIKNGTSNIIKMYIATGKCILASLAVISTPNPPKNRS